MMDNASVIAIGSILLNVVIGVLGYLMRDKLESTGLRLKEVEDAVVEVKVHYAHKADVQAMKQEILNRFDRLEDKLTQAK